MSGIVLSAATRQSLLAAQDTASMLATTQNRLATGKKVTSALDNPLNFFTAASLDNRASDLSGLLDNISNGIQTVQAANQGITNIQKLVDSAKSTATQALAAKSAASSSASSATSASAVATASMKSFAIAAGSAAGTFDFSASARSTFTVTDGNSRVSTIDLKSSTLLGSVADLSKVTDDELLAKINEQLSTQADAGGAAVTATKSVDGRLTFVSTATGSDATVTLTGITNNATNIGFGTATSGSIGSGTGVDATDGSTKARLTGTSLAALKTAGGIDFTSTGDASLTLQLGDGAVKTINLTKAADATLGALSTAKGTDVAAAINRAISADTGLAGLVKAEGSNTDGTVTIRSTAQGSDQKVTVKSIGAVDIGFGTGSAGTPGAAKSASGAGSTAATANNQRAALAQQFNDLLDQITQLAKDSSFNGTNLLYRSGNDAKENTLHISFNEKDTSSLDIKGVKFDATGLGIGQANGGFSSDDDIKTALGQLTSASTNLRSQASTFGSNLTVVQNRQDFSKQLINVLQTGSGNLTNADLNEEAANSQALSTRQSLAISALSLANTSQQQVLQLLR